MVDKKDFELLSNSGYHLVTGQYLAKIHAVNSLILDRIEVISARLQKNAPLTDEESTKVRQTAEQSRVAAERAAVDLVLTALQQTTEAAVDAVIDLRGHEE
jgi:hypothetical protein